LVLGGGVLTVVVGVVVWLTAFGGTAVTRSLTDPNAPIPVVVPPSPGNLRPYMDAIDQAGRDGLHVWIETDLVKRWRAGSTSFRQGIDAVAAEARNSAVVGIKIADELGYHDGLTTSAEVTTFLDATASALRAQAPGKLILVDVVVPELGCLPGYSPPLPQAVSCGATMRREFPQLTIAAFGGYLKRHDIDVLDVSADLKDDSTYAAWGVNANTAESVAWQAITAQGWPSLARLNGRKALAHPGKYGGSASDAEATLHTFVDVPRQFGAQAIDIWTWRQRYQGSVYQLTDPGAADNPLWSGILARRRNGVQLFTHFSPTSVESNVADDLKQISTAFTDVFVAAGTG
jgi:hypothetical protein